MGNTNDVAHAVADKINSRHCGLLGITRHIRRNKGQQRHKRRRTRLREIVPSKTPAVVMERQSNDQDHAQHGGNEAGAADEDPVAEAIAEVAAHDQGDDFDGAAGGAVEEGFFGGVAKGDDELGEEVADAAVWNVRHTGIEGERPRQWVEQGFFELVQFEMLVPDTLLVDADSLHRQYSVGLAQESCVELVIGHDEEEDATDNTSQETCH